MIYVTKKYPEKSIVYRYLFISGLPKRVAIIRDSYGGGFIAYMPEMSKIVVQGNTVKETIDSLRRIYEKTDDFYFQNNIKNKIL